MRVGLGTGSTAAWMVRCLGELVREEGLNIRGVPTSSRTAKLAADVGINVVTLEEARWLDLTIDGADEFDEDLNLIKGGGGALLHEKIVASASRELIIIVDSRKSARPLGSSFHLPVEVIPYAHIVVQQALRELGSTPKLRCNNDKPFVTDEGNYIFDCNFNTIADPRKLAGDISQIPGVVEHGLFIGMTTKVIIGSGESTRELQA